MDFTAVDVMDPEALVLVRQHVRVVIEEPYHHQLPSRPVLYWRWTFGRPINPGLVVPSSPSSSCFADGFHTTDELVEHNQEEREGGP